MSPPRFVPVVIVAFIPKVKKPWHAHPNLLCSAPMPPRKHEPVYYADYLGLDSLLGAQRPKSAVSGKAAHDEMLFIVVHQVYELWFKQILHELGSVLADFAGPVVDERAVGVAVARLGRVGEIQKILIAQLSVLETMTPLDFLDFRDYLTPASGFQSFQFRLIEDALGLAQARRVRLDETPYYSRLSKEHQDLIKAGHERPSLFSLVEAWLERTPFVGLGDFDFWKAYAGAVDAMLSGDEAIIRENPTLGEAEREQELQELGKTRESFDSLLDARKFETLRTEGVWRMSQKALLAALFVHLYRDQPILHLPFRLLEALVEIDENFSIWRYRHAIMVHRMIGTKIGTGGSSGHQYLKRTAETHRVFMDFFQLSTFLIPRSARPELPREVERALGFVHGG